MKGKLLVQIVRNEVLTKSAILTILEEEANEQGLSLEYLIRRMKMNGFNLEQAVLNPSYTERKIREFAMWSKHAIAIN